jgi:hypothetical protein
MKQINYEYDLFEKFPNGSSLWRGSFSEFETACHRVKELAEKSENQFYAVSLTTGEAVAVDSERTAPEFLEPQKAKKRSKGQAA